jgi:integrase
VWNGQRVSGSAKPTYEEAKASYRQKIQELENPAPAAPEPEPKMPTVSEYMAKVLDGPWRARLRHNTMAPSTWQMAEQVLRLNVIGSKLGAMPLGKVFPADLELWTSELMTQERKMKTKVIKPRPMGNTTKRRYLGILDGVFEYARRQEKLIEVNPARDVPKPPEDEVEFWALSAKEVEELLELCDKEDPNADVIDWEKRRREHSNHRRRKMCLLLLHGYGPAEACGARYEDFDGEGIMPRLQRQRLRELGVVNRDRLKTKARRGWVAIDEELKELLSEQKEGFVLAGMNGKAMEPGNLRRCFAGMVKGTKFEKLTPYDLRHTFAMRMIEEGIDVQTAAEQMRHSTQVFLDKYVRSDRARKLAAARKMQEARERAKSGQS